MTTLTPAPSGPLAGIRVIDFTSIYSGPIATAILGDQGADVIKIEPAEGDLMRRGRPSRNEVSAHFAMMNRNKRSLVVDARSEPGREILHDLIRSGDVVVENFRPGVMDRLGIGYDQAAALNPRIVFVSINGVGSTGPYAGRRVYDAVIQAVSGVAALQSDASGQPQMVNTLVCDKITSVNAAQVITAALFARERSGVGQRVELSMLDAALNFVWPDGMHNQTFVGDDVERAPNLDHAMFVRATADGYVAVMPVKAAEWEGTFKALGLTELWNADPRFATAQARQQNSEILQASLNDAYASFSTDEICQRLEANDVPFARINGRDDVVHDPQIVAMEAIEYFDHPHGGPMRQPRPQGRFSDTPAAIHRCSPMLGEHTEEVLREIGRDAADIDALRAAGVIC